MKKSGVLIAIALFCAAYLSTALVVLGLDKFDYLLAGGKKFPTFPNVGIQIGIGLSYLTLAFLYLVWFLGTKRLYAYSRFRNILQDSSIFLILAFIAYPLGNDIYLYLHAGLMNLSSVNPFLVRAATFMSELSPFVDWGQTSTYGPVSQTLFSLSAAFLTISPILAIYVFKAICLGLHILNGYLIWRLLQVPERGKIAIAYLLNPLLLMEQVGSAHVDILVSTSVIVCFGCLTQRRAIPALASIWGGILSKTIPLVWIPLLGIFLIRQRRWWQLVSALLLSLGLIGLLWSTVLPGWAAWSSLLNPGVTGQYQSSLHAFAKFGLDLVRIFSPASMNLLQEQKYLIIVSKFTLAGFAGFYAWIGWRAWRQRDYAPTNLVEDMGWVVLVLLLVATPWLMPWYASILITIAALIPRSQLFGFTSLMFGFSSSAQYLLLGHNAIKSLVAVGIPAIAFVIGLQLLSPQFVKVAGRSTSAA